MNKLPKQATQLQSQFNAYERGLTETLQDTSISFPDRVAAAIGASVPSSYEWIRSGYEYAQKHDNRVKHLVQLGKTTTERSVIIAVREQSARNIGHGMLLCTLDTVQPWSVESVVDREGMQDLSLVAHITPDALLITHTKDNSDCSCHSRLVTHPSVEPFSESRLVINLPTFPMGIVHFVERLEELQNISGIGVAGIQQIAKHIANVDNKPHAEATLLAGAIMATKR